MANTISNLFSIAIAVLGYNLARQESLPARYLAGYIVRHHPLLSIPL